MFSNSLFNDINGDGFRPLDVNFEMRECRKDVPNSLPDSAIPAMHMYSLAKAGEGGAETYLVVRTAASRRQPLPTVYALPLR